MLFLEERTNAGAVFVMSSSNQVVPLVLCGGAGTRLWPLSRTDNPKQFASFLSDKSLFQQTAQLCTGEGFDAPVVSTSHDLRFTVVQQLAEIEMTPRSVLIEPTPKDTATAILAAVLSIQESQPDALVLVLPSDHLIPNREAFKAAIETASRSAAECQIVTLGIEPTHAETGYGYLELPEAKSGDVTEAIPLSRFVEKPDHATAEQMVASDRYLWNAGIFLFQPQTLVEEFEEQAPDTLRRVRASVEGIEQDLSFSRLEESNWAVLKPISIDYAIMENSTRVTVVPYAAGWSDLGDWNAVYELNDKDETHNATAGDVTLIDCDNSLFWNGSEILTLVGLGLSDVVVVGLPDAMLVAKKSEVQNVKQAVKLLRDKAVPQADRSSREYRPWGYFESLVQGDRFQVKKICVYPGGKLSLQHHFHRSEHWVVVEGTAEVVIEERVMVVSENESVYIPLGSKHRLINPGKSSMILIEVQTGSYLGEDDIVRHEDHYARS